MEQSVIFTINNGVAQSVWTLQPPSGQQHNLREQEEAEFLDDWSDDDDDLTLSQLMAMRYINRVRTINHPAWAREVEFRDLLAHHRQEANGGGAVEVGDDVVFVPASDAAVASLEKKKQAFRAAAEGYDDHECGGSVTTGCAICLDDFEDGEEVTVMPCFRGHEFHPDCIAKWLGKSNTCPLCRHALPTDDVMDDDGL